MGIIREDYKQSNNVSSQFNKTYQSTVSTVGNAVEGGIKAITSSIGDTVSNIGEAAGALGKQGMSALTSVSQAAKQLSALGSSSKFKDNFVPPSKIDDVTPDDTSRMSSGYLGTLFYPEDLGQYFIMFTFKKYDRKVPLNNPIDVPGITISLPIPSNMVEQFNMTYSDINLGVAGIAEKLLPNFNKGAEAAGTEAAKNVKNFINNLGAGETAFYAARTIAGLTDSTAGALEKVTGAVKNPFQALLFQGVNLRTHTFSYRFSPSDETESRNIKKIIYEFKSRMHPTADNLVYLFPDLVDIKFGKKEGEPYFFKTCFLESMTVNYAPQGSPAFFARTNEPVEIELTLNFKETSQLTRRDFMPAEPDSVIQYSPY